MDRLEGIKIFVRVVESGSFSAVARELGTGSRRSASRFPRSRNVLARNYSCAPPAV